MLKIIAIPLPTPWPAVGDVHTYLIQNDPITLVDTGVNTPESRQALLAGLQSAGVRPQDIKRLLVTHAHLDHSGQAAWLQAEAATEVWLHPHEAGKASLPAWWLKGRQRILDDCGVPSETQALIHESWERGRHIALPLTAWNSLHDGQRYEFDGGALEAVHLPGHAPGHTGFWEAATGRLIGGDHLLEQVTPNPIAEPLPAGHPGAVSHAPHRALTLGQFLGALDRVMAMPVKQVLPGHGPVIENHVTVAQRYVASHERRLTRLHGRLADGRTVYQLTREVYPWVKEYNIFLALSEVLAHLDLLVTQGRAAVEPGPAGDMFRPV